MDNNKIIDDLIEENGVLEAEIERLRDSVAEVNKLRQRISELEDRVSDLEQSHG